MYDKLSIKREDVGYLRKARLNPRLKGKLCIRSGSHPYNLSLFGAVTEHLGPEKTEAWLKGMVANMARPLKVAIPDQRRGQR